MKHLLVFTISLIIIIGNLSSQKIGHAPDFTITDTDGNTVNLYEALENDKTVLMFFFSIHCGSCHIEAERLDSIWEATGSGNQDVLIWAFESTYLYDVTDEGVQEFKDYHNLSFPFFSNYNQTKVFELFNINYTPQMHIVCPDKRTTEILFKAILESIEGCASTQIEENEIKKLVTIDYIHNGIIAKNNTDKSINIEIYSINGQLLTSEQIPALSSKNIVKNSQNNFAIIRIISENHSFYKKYVSYN